MITREEAIDALMQLEGSDILSEELEDQIGEIICCIEEEMIGRHIWGAEGDEVAKLHIAHRKDLWTDELIKECEEIENKISFKPAPYEKEEIERNIKDEFNLWSDDKEEKEDAPDELPFP